MKDWFLENIHKTDKLLATLNQEKREGAQIKSEMKEEDIITDNKEIQRIIKDCYGQSHANKLEN